jgi:hypothetical protein
MDMKSLWDKSQTLHILFFKKVTAHLYLSSNHIHASRYLY